MVTATTTTTRFNGSDGHKHGKYTLEKGLLTCKFDDFRGFAVSTNFGVSIRKSGLEFCYPISAYKMCHLH